MVWFHFKLAADNFVRSCTDKAYRKLFEIQTHIRSAGRIVFFSLSLSTIFETTAVAAGCDEAFRPIQDVILTQALSVGRKLYLNPSATIPYDVYIHGTSLEALADAVTRGGFIGGRVVDDIELKHLWRSHSNKRAFFMMPAKQLLDLHRHESQNPLLIREIQQDTYAAMSAFNHYILTKLGLDFDTGKRLGLVEIFEVEKDGDGTWADMLKQIRKQGADPERRALAERLTAKFGASQIEKWIEEARLRGGIVILFKKSVEKISSFNKTRMEDEWVTVLDEPLPLHHIYAVIPYNDFAEQKLSERYSAKEPRNNSR